MNHFTLLTAAFFIVTLLVSPLHAVAQSTIDDISSADLIAAPEDVGTDGMSSAEDSLIGSQSDVVPCFDYYTFGSVRADLAPSVMNTVSGTPLTFEGTLYNDNTYPIVDGTLYVKIFKQRGEGNDGNGADVVDQFVAVNDITIPAGGSIPASFTWTVPSYAVSGDYALATFFVTSDRFNLLGLSFTDDIIGNVTRFAVTGEQETGVQFRKDGVTIGGEPYFFATPPLRQPADAPVTIEATLTNTTATEQVVPVTWTIYQWDAQRAENIVQQSADAVTVPAGGEAVADITVTDARYPVYFAVATANYKDTKSVLGIRFVREGIDHPRLNFPGLTSFPLEAGKTNTLFSCLHNANEGVIENGALLLTLKGDGEEIHRHEYEGPITGSMMAIASPFVPAKAYDSVTLTAQLSQNGQVVDEVSIVYDCAQIDSATCFPEPDPNAVGGTSNESGWAAVSTTVWVSITLLILVLLGLAHLLRNRRQGNVTNFSN